MPSVKGKGSGGRRNEAAAKNGKKVGAPPKYWRIPIESGRFPVAIDVEAVGLTQRLLLDHPECRDVGDVVSLAVRRLAESPPKLVTKPLDNVH